VRINPRAAEARFGYAMALVRLRRYREARDWLTEATRDQPDRPDLAHALARVLAASPDARVRDGQRAMALVDELFKGQKTTELGETMAMTLAELGDYQQAAAIQRDVMQAAQRAGLERDVTRMAANLRLYERGQPCRTPWTDDDPVHSPGPPVASQ
jgi:cytochrome c-type biogenesis protein CcmH/NrfG